MNESKNARTQAGTGRHRQRRTSAILRILVGMALACLVIGVPRIRGVHAETTRFVAAVGGTDLGGTNDCSNPGQPCATIQNAVNHSGVGDVISLGPV
jgi:hypothetical protein